jgi:guanylate cyclase soluble subunit beta
MNADLPVGCPFSGAGRKPSLSQRTKKCSVRRQSELFRDYSEEKPFHDLSLPLRAGTEPYSDIELQECYGAAFKKRFENPDSAELLKSIALNLFDLLNSLESLHVHLFVEQIPVIRIPYQMNCEMRESDGVLVFHFFSPPNSRFIDPKNMVAGIIKQVSLFAFKMQVSVDMELEEWGGKLGEIRHCRFAIKEVPPEGEEPVRRLFPCNSVTNYYFPRELLVSPKTLCRACPFHIIFDHDLNLVEIGSSLQRLLRIEMNEDGTVATNLSFSHIFELKRPTVDHVSFNTFVERLNSVVELQIKESAAIVVTRNRSRSRSRSRTHSLGEEEENGTDRHACITIRGQMIHVPESNSLLYLGSPLVRTLDEVDAFGLYISDIAIHDATRDLILTNGAYQGHLTLVDQLEKTNHDIEVAQQNMKEQQERSNKLLRSMLPNPVADSLLRGEEIIPQQYDSVTVMFSDLTNFADLTAEWEPRQIVDMLNRMYTEFDEILPCHNVYKVETVNDSYMVVGGCPEPNEHHAREVARMAIDMMDSMDFIEHPITLSPLTGQLRIGIHSGAIRAGVVGTERPRYCLFGDTVNVTSRTLTAAGTKFPGSIAVTEHAYEKLKQYTEFDLQNPREVLMKGVDKPVTCYTLTRKERSASIGSQDSTQFRKTSKQITFEWMNYCPTASGLSLDRRYLGGRSVSCPQPVGNPAFRYSSKLLRGGGGRRGGADKNVTAGFQRFLLPDGKTEVDGEANDIQQIRSNRSSVSSTGGRTTRSSSTSSCVRSHRTSVSHGPGGLMITVAPSSTSKSRKVSSLAVMREDDEASEDFSATSSEANSRSTSQQNSRSSSWQHNSVTDNPFSPDLSMNMSPPCVYVMDDDGTDIDGTSLPELLEFNYSMQRPMLETDV